MLQKALMSLTPVDACSTLQLRHSIVDNAPFFHVDAAVGVVEAGSSRQPSLSTTEDDSDSSSSGNSSSDTELDDMPPSPLSDNASYRAPNSSDEERAPSVGGGAGSTTHTAHSAPAQQQQQQQRTEVELARLAGAHSFSDDESDGPASSRNLVVVDAMIQAAQRPPTQQVSVQQSIVEGEEAVQDRGDDAAGGDAVGGDDVDVDVVV